MKEQMMAGSAGLSASKNQWGENYKNGRALDRSAFTEAIQGD
jgi:hypothetical protein